MKVHGNIDLLENALKNACIGADTNFPTDPKPGRFVFKDKVLYFCTQIADTLPVWVPITKVREMILHTQSVAALEWTVPHDLNVAAVFVQVYDENGKWIIPDDIIVTLNNVLVKFNTPITGVVVIQRGETEGSSPAMIAFEQNFASSSEWIVNHQLGHNPIIRCIVNGNEVQPQNIEYTNTMSAKITWSSPQAGSVRCI